MEKEIEVIKPQAYERVGPEFILEGRISKACLRTDWGGTDYRVLGSFVDIEGCEFASTVTAYVQHNFLSLFKKKLHFSAKAQFSQFNVPFIAKSQGRINLKLSGHKKGCDVFVPLIVEGFESKEGVSPRIAERHPKIGQIMRQYEQDLKNYYRELELINASRKSKEDREERYLYGQNVSIASDILKILDESDENFDEYTYSDEDRRERELEEKYKDALNWRGPLLRGIVSQLGGFELRVYSDDHGKHFHVIHRDKGIDARFSFPDMRLMNYKIAKTTIGSKAEKKSGSIVFAQKFLKDSKKNLISEVSY